MSGHSKWSTIKRKKEAIDHKKGKVFSQIARQIRVAVKEGASGDPAQNASLRMILEKAKSANMPKDNIARAIDKGLGKSKNGTMYEEVLYEGYGPGGVGILAVAVTDNRNRTGSEIRNVFTKAGGSLGGPGSAAYLFRKLSDGTYEVAIPIQVSDEKEMVALETLISQLEENDDVEQVFSAATMES